MQQKGMDLIAGVVAVAAIGIGITGQCAARSAPMDRQGGVTGSTVTTPSPSPLTSSPTVGAPLSRRFPVEPDWKGPELPAGTVAEAAVGNPATWIDPEKDYPPEARGLGHEGSTGIGFLIGKDGRITDCHVMISSGDASLDDRSCEVAIEKGRYSPARDAKGNPLIVGMTLRFTWRMDRSVPQVRPLADLIEVASATISANGAVSDCSISQEVGGKAAVTTAVPCNVIMQQVIANQLYSLAGTGSDLRVVLEIGTTQNDAVMARRIAERSGWRTMAMTSAWWTVSETGEESDCKIDQHRGSGYPEPDLCWAPVMHYERPVDSDGKPTHVRMGQSMAIFAQSVPPKK